ncbi:MAG: hypothetical protein ACO1O1_02280 [Adhaeribacter sp.]
MNMKLASWFLGAWVLLVPAFSFGQEADPAAEPGPSRGWWTASLEAANNSSFYGRISPRAYPYVAPTLTYVHPLGIWASATAYQLFNTADYIDETDLSLGYSFRIRQKVDANLSYSHFFFSKNSPLVKAATSNAVSAYAALDWKYVFTAFTTSYIFGRSNDVFTVLENSRYLPLNPLWKGKTAIGLDPKITLTAGTQEFYQEYTTTETYQNDLAKSGQGNGNKGPIGGVLDPLLPGGGQGNGNGNGNGNSNTGSNTGGNGSTTTTTTTYTTAKKQFRVLNYDFKVPLVVLLGSFEVEPSWRYSIPVNKLAGDPSRSRSFYALNLTYSF